MKRLANYLIATALLAFTLTSCEDVPSPFGEVVPPPSPETDVIDPAGSGTEKDPYNVAGVLEFISGLGADTPSEKEVYIKGYAVELTDISAQYGNATFTMSDDVDGKANKFTVYRAAGLGNQKVTDANFIKQGDVVVICGKVINYKGNTPETVQGSAYVYSVNGETGGGGGGGDTPSPGEAKGTGTQADPFNVAAAVAKCKETGETATKDVYFVKGIVAADYTVDSYKNATFDMIDAEGATEKFTAFRVKGPDGANLKEGYKIPKGATVLISGNLVNFKGNTPETAQNTGTLITVNDKAPEVEGGGGGGGDTPTPGSPQGTGTEADPFNVAAAIAKCQETGQTATNEEYYVKGIADDDCTIADDNYKNATFDMVDAAGSADKFKAFRVLAPNGQKLKAGYKIPKGATVIVCGKLVNYKGNTPETVQTTNPAYNGTLVSVNGQAPEVDGGGEQGGGSGEASSGDITAAATSFGFTDKADATTTTLSDGTKLTFDKGEGSTGPKYYAGDYASVRMYAKNTLKIESSKIISKIVITTSTPYQGTKYNGNDQAYAESSGSKVTIKKNSDTEVEFSGLSSSTVLICNDFTEAKGGTQLRLSSITITYGN